MAKGVLIAAMDFSNAAADEFNDWYDTEHIPERQRVRGFLTLQRWIGVENPRQSFATYHLESLSELLQGREDALLYLGTDLLFSEVFLRDRVDGGPDGFDAKENGR